MRSWLQNISKGTITVLIRKADSRFVQHPLRSMSMYEFDPEKDILSDSMRNYYRQLHELGIRLYDILDDGEMIEEKSNVMRFQVDQTPEPLSEAVEEELKNDVEPEDTSDTEAVVDTSDTEVIGESEEVTSEVAESLSEADFGAILAELDSKFEIDALKAKADELGIAYGARSSKSTIIKKILESEEGLAWATSEIQ